MFGSSRGKDRQSCVMTTVSLCVRTIIYHGEFYYSEVPIKCIDTLIHLFVCLFIWVHPGGRIDRVVSWQQCHFAWGLSSTMGSSTIQNCLISLLVGLFICRNLWIVCLFVWLGRQILPGEGLTLCHDNSVTLHQDYHLQRHRRCSACAQARQLSYVRPP